MHSCVTTYCPQASPSFLVLYVVTALVYYIPYSTSRGALTITYFTRIFILNLTSRWSQAELLVGSFPLQFLLRHLPIFPLIQFLLIPPTSESSPLIRRSQKSEDRQLQVQHSVFVSNHYYYYYYYYYVTMR